MDQCGPAFRRGCSYLPAVSINVGYFCQFGIGPKMFQVIEMSFVGQENVYDDISIVKGHPLGVADAIDAIGFLSGGVSYIFPYGVDNGQYLAG